MGKKKDVEFLKQSLVSIPEMVSPQDKLHNTVGFNTHTHTHTHTERERERERENFSLSHISKAHRENESSPLLLLH